MRTKAAGTANQQATLCCHLFVPPTAAFCPRPLLPSHLPSQSCPGGCCFDWTSSERGQEGVKKPSVYRHQMGDACRSVPTLDRRVCQRQRSFSSLNLHVVWARQPGMLLRGWVSQEGGSTVTSSQDGRPSSHSIAQAQACHSSTAYPAGRQSGRWGERSKAKAKSIRGSQKMLAGQEERAGPRLTAAAGRDGCVRRHAGILVRREEMHALGAAGLERRRSELARPTGPSACQAGCGGRRHRRRVGQADRRGRQRGGGVEAVHRHHGVGASCRWQAGLAGENRSWHACCGHSTAGL
jgi:hypothetical protein